MTARRADRVAGLLLLTLAVAAALDAQRFTVTFLTDPLGPKAFPLVAAALLGVAGAGVLARRGDASSWPPPAVARRLAAACGSLLLYALLLGLLGFVLATTLETAALSLLFGGRPVRSVLSAMLFSAALYGLFVYGLELSLPVGRVFGGP